MKKSLIALILICVIASVLIYQNRSNPESNNDSKPTIKIGVTLPLTGDAAQFGLTNQEAVNLALNKWKNQPTKFNYEAIFMDDKVSPKQGILNASNLIGNYHINAILSQWTPVGVVVSPIAEKNQIIHFTCSFGDEVTKGDYNFNHYTSFEEQSKTLIQKFQKENIKNINYVIVNTSGCAEQSDYVIKKLKEAGINILNTQYYNPDERDFRIMISKLEQANPDYYLLCTAPPSSQIFIKQLGEITGRKNITAIDSFNEMNKEDLSLVEGLWFVSSASGTEQFAEYFQAETGKETTSCAANLYDAVDLLIRAYEKSGTADNKQVIETLYKTRNHTGAAGLVSIDNQGIVQSKASIKVVKDGKIVDLKE